MNRPPWLRPEVSLLLLALGAAPARAHNGYPDTTSITVRRGHPGQMWLGATFGAIVTQNGGTSWHWVCPEALGYGSSRCGCRAVPRFQHPPTVEPSPMESRAD